MTLRQAISYCHVVIEDVLLTAPFPGYKPRLAADEIDLRHKISELRTQGYTSLGSVLTADELAELRQSFDAAIRGERSDITVSWSESVKYWYIANSLRLDGLLPRLAVHPLAIALVERYFGRRPYLSDVDMRRIPPVDMLELEKIGYSSSNWHRDTRGRQLKLMIYLSDVGENDSNFALLPATHIGAHYRPKTFMESRISDDKVSGMANQPLEWYGQAGDAMLFDTNLIHRLRRKSSARLRDSVTFYYTPGQALSHLDIDESAVASLPAVTRGIFASPALPFRRMYTP